MTLDQLLKAVDQTYLRPDPERLRRAKDSAEGLVDALDRAQDAWMFQVVRHEQHGSLSRGTGLRGFKDVDYMVVFKAGALKTSVGHERTASDTIHRMANRLRRSRAGLIVQGHVQIRAQNHSVGVTYPNQDYRLDLVPAVVSGRSGWVKIPEKSSGEWIRTNPTRHREALAAAMDKSPATLHAVRLIKAWSRARGWRVSLPSFAIESLIIPRAAAKRQSTSQLVSGLFTDIGGADMRRRLDLGTSPLANPPPIFIPSLVTGDNLTHELTATHRRGLIDACRDAMEGLEEIEAKLRLGKDGPAMTAARKLFVGRWG